MTKEQVQLLRNEYTKVATSPEGKKATIGVYIRFCLDGNIDFVTSKDFVIYDDANNMLHMIAINNNGNQSNYPFMIMSCDYGVIQQIETIMSRDNFDKFLKESTLFNKLLSKDQKTFITEWAGNIKLQGQQEPKASPYYTHTAGIQNMPTLPHERDDGITHIESPTPTGKIVESEEGGSEPTPEPGESESDGT